jgi:sodium/potassium-transporting ATPase subunit alpha
MMDSLKSLQSTEIAAIRDGKVCKVNISELVKGDVVKINGGDKIPADCRIFGSKGLLVDNSPLTGETKPVKIETEPGMKGMKNTMEALNIVFFSTLCKEGDAIGIVTDIGPNTFMGKIADLAASAEPEMTTLQRELDAYIKLTASVAVTLGVLFFILGIIIKYPIITNFIFAIGIIVANVPEGLGYAVTSILALVAQKMLRRNVFVKNLQSVETLGSITCICSDKTGTLTQNKMMIVHLWYDMQFKKVRSDQEDIRIDNRDIKMTEFNFLEPSFEIMKFVGVCGSKETFLTSVPDDFTPFSNKKKELEKKIKDKIKLNQAVERLRNDFQPEYDKFYEENINERVTDPGNASEAACIKFFEKYESIERLRTRCPIHTYNNQEIAIPFNSTLKFACFMRRIYLNREDYNLQLAFKGAPELLLKRCNTYLKEGKECPIDKEFLEEFKFANKAFALKGERVIGFAYKRLDPEKFNASTEFKISADESNPSLPINDLCFVGLIAMEDPPRPGVKEAIKTCHEAGIKVIMVTGDQPLTAASIAYQIGIIKNLDDTPEIIMEKEKLSSLEEAEKKSNTIIITGDRIAKMLKDEEELSEDNPKKGALLRSWILKRDVVFARTSPQHKLAIVDACQRLSHCVAVTGDGVNDSPAMKKADIGVAMGKVGTDVAKDAADILLLDDNFANIVKGIKQGRVVFDILKKIIRYNLSSNYAELIPFIGFVILQFPLPLTTLQLLCMDVGTNIYPNICFAYEIAEDNIMKRRPRNVKTDRLCPLILFSYGYLFAGTVQTAGVFLMYFAAANDYGLPPNSLFFIVNTNGIEPAFQDVYNPYDQAFRGNSNAFVNKYSDVLGLYGEAYDIAVNSKVRALDYSSSADEAVDMRLFYQSFESSKFGACYVDSVGQNYDGPVCYRVEAIRHAQAAYLLGHIIMQVANGISSRVKLESVFKHKFKNMPMNVGYLIEIAIIAILLYVPGLNTAFQVRALRFQHWIPCLGMFIVFLLYDEFTRLLMRIVKKPDGSPGFFYEYFNY